MVISSFVFHLILSWYLYHMLVIILNGYTIYLVALLFTKLHFFLLLFILRMVLEAVDNLTRL
jgi:hypothetical protein